MAACWNVDRSGLFRVLMTEGVRRWSLLALVGWLYLGYAWLRRLADYDPPVCLFLAITHVPCLLCGMTRAFGWLMMGDLGRAQAFHGLVIPAFTGWMAMTVTGTWLFGAALVRRRREILRPV